MRREIKPGDRVRYASCYINTLPRSSSSRTAVGTVREISSVGIIHFALVDWESPNNPGEHDLANVAVRNLRRA